MSELTQLTLKAALDGLKSRAFSSEEITRDFIAAIEKARPLNAYVLETPEKAPEASPSRAAFKVSPVRSDIYSTTFGTT